MVLFRFKGRMAAGPWSLLVPRATFVLLGDGILQIKINITSHKKAFNEYSKERQNGVKGNKGSVTWRW